MKTYVFDIDGTICHNANSDYENSVPMTERIKKINDLYDEGNTIIFQTARGMGRSKNSSAFAYAKFYELTQDQLRKWGVKYHSLFLGKPAGDVYIDDKGINDEDFFTN
jgi:histidinol phosphatase-like enzyme